MLRTFSVTAGTLVLSLFKAISKPGSREKDLKKKRKKKTRQFDYFCVFSVYIFGWQDESKAERFPPPLCKQVVFTGS